MDVFLPSAWRVIEKLIVVRKPCIFHYLWAPRLNPPQKQMASGQADGDKEKGEVKHTCMYVSLHSFKVRLYGLGGEKEVLTFNIVSP